MQYVMKHAKLFAFANVENSILDLGGELLEKIISESSLNYVDVRQDKISTISIMRIIKAASKVRHEVDLHTGSEFVL